MKNWQKIQACFESLRTVVSAPRQGIDVPMNPHGRHGALDPVWFMDQVVAAYPELAGKKTTVDRHRRREEQRNPSNSVEILEQVWSDRNRLA